MPQSDKKSLTGRNPSSTQHQYRQSAEADARRTKNSRPPTKSKPHSVPDCSLEERHRSDDRITAFMSNKGCRPLTDNAQVWQVQPQMNSYLRPPKAEALRAHGPTCRGRSGRRPSPWVREKTTNSRRRRIERNPRLRGLRLRRTALLGGSGFPAGGRPLCEDLRGLSPQLRMDRAYAR